MGNAVLTARSALRWTAIAVALLAAACAPPEPGEGDDAPADAIVAAGAHADLACSACHSGARGARQVGAVPAASCAEAGCHEEGGPPRVQVAQASFDHRDHAPDADIEFGCAGCHTHAEGDDPLRATVDACALCHLTEIGEGVSDECRVCHERPRHVQFTSQGVPIPHAALPWLETGCVRCHYDVAEPPVAVGADRCDACHRDPEQAVAGGIGTDLHPSHTGVGCTSCHESGLHHVRLMSSAVDLACVDCHLAAHGLLVPPPAPLDADDVTVVGGPALCQACHGGVHRAQQELLLGLVPGTDPAPAPKFLGGMTCRSCHVPPRAPADSAIPLRGTAEACAGCHPANYGEVLDWWLEGMRTRVRQTDAYLTAAERAVGGVPGDAAHDLLAGARLMLVTVIEAGGHHNLELADRILREVVDRTVAAYRTSGSAPPPRPDLGTRPHEGLCSYCHYATDEPWNFDRMPDAFHRAALSRAAGKARPTPSGRNP